MTKNDAKVAKHQETVKEEILTGGSFLDHGFTRPKVVSIAFLSMLIIGLSSIRSLELVLYDFQYCFYNSSMHVI